MTGSNHQLPRTPPNSEWALALAGSIEREVQECYDHQRKPGDEHALTMTHRGLLDLANALRFASEVRSESTSRDAVLEEAAKVCSEMAANGRKGDTQAGRHAAGALDMAAYKLRAMRGERGWP